MPLGRKAATMLAALDKFLVQGLGALEPKTARMLGKFLRANGFGTAAERARLFSEEGPEKRYKAYVELRIALEASLVKLYRPKFAALPPESLGRDHVREGELPATPDELELAARSFPGTAGARAYLQSGPDLAGLTPEQVATLLSNDDLRRLAGRVLAQAPPERVREWVDDLVTRRNGLARRGAYLLVGALPPEDRVLATQPSWSLPEDQDTAFECFHPDRAEARDGFRHALSPEKEAPPEARRFALSLVARGARPDETDTWAQAVEGDPIGEALVEVGRFKAGQIDANQLRSHAASLDQPELRALATAQLYLEGELDSKRFLKEVPRAQEAGHLDLLLGPLRNTSKVEPLERHWRAQLHLERSVEERKAAVVQAVTCGDRRMVPVLLRALPDPDEGVHQLLLEALTGVEGLLPIRTTVDLLPLELGAFDALTTDMLRGYERSLLPVVHRVPDRRLAPFLGLRLRRGGADAVPAEALRAMGEAMIPVLATLIDHEDRALALLARRELEALRPHPEVEALLDARAAGQDPLESAVDRLLVEGLEDAAREELEAFDRAESVPRLLELARSRKEAREPLLELLTAWRADETLPLLIKLLGSPVPDMVRGRTGNRESRWLQKSVTEHLRAFGDAARPSLEEALSSENWTVRHHAAHLLADLGTPGSSGPLATALETEPEPETRTQLVTALGASGGEEAVEPLAALARGGETAMQLKAIRALGQVGIPAARAHLEELLAEASDLALKRELRKALEACGEGA